MFKNHKSYTLILASLGLSVTLLSGCFHSDSDSDSVQTRDGYLIDAAVSGLHYEIRSSSGTTSSSSGTVVLANGITEADGRFIMRSESNASASRRSEMLTVEFYLGDLDEARDRLILGSAEVPGLSDRDTTVILTPIDLSTTEAVVVNIAQIIQSLDDNTSMARINIPESAHVAVTSATSATSAPLPLSTAISTFAQLFPGSTIMDGGVAELEVIDNWGCQFAGLYRDAEASATATTGTLFALKPNAKLDGYFYNTAATADTVQLSGGLRFSDGNLILYSSDAIIGGTSATGQAAWVGARQFETKGFSIVRASSTTPLSNINIEEIRTKSVLFPDYLITGAATSGTDTFLIELVVNGAGVSGYLIKPDRSVATIISGTYNVAINEAGEPLGIGEIEATDDEGGEYEGDILLSSMMGNAVSVQFDELDYFSVNGDQLVAFDTADASACSP